MNTKLCKGYIKDSYPIYLSEDETFSDLDGLLPASQKRFVIIDPIVADQHPLLLKSLQKNQTFVYKITSSESNKSLQGLEHLFEQVFEQRPSRDDIIIAVGGGAIINLAGLAGSLITRGLRFYYIPTTLTGQIDASIGSKQAVNFRGAKNWIGMFNDPEWCYVNTTVVSTLSTREFASQAVEGFKLCLATNKSLFEKYKANINLLCPTYPDMEIFVSDMLDVKLKVLEEDILEENYGMCMLYGHTIGHAIEMLDHENTNHGEAVGLGMLAAAHISNMLGFSDVDLISTHKQLLEELGLPDKIPSHVSQDAIVDLLAHNKKNYGGQIRFVLLEKTGKMVKQDSNFFVTVPKDTIVKAIKEMY